jgi:site-specific recombinase XerD
MAILRGKNPDYSGSWRKMMSSKTALTQGTIVINESIEVWAKEFILDRKVRGLSPGTIRFYRQKLKLFLGWCDAQVISNLTELEPNTIRHYLLYLEDTGHNKGGIHACYRALKAFLNWWEDEFEPDTWRNPIHKVKPPKQDVAPIEGIHIDTLKALLDTCEGNKFTEKRDKAIMLFLFDTGVRAGEFCSLNLEDMDRTFRSVIIRKGKGGKPRTVFLSKKTRSALRAYLRQRKDESVSLWVTIHGSRLSYDGLREIMKRRGKTAGVKPPRLHDFRRGFALECLRNGMDVYSLQKLMGHADLQVLQRYLAQTTEDISRAHRIGSPVDNSSL